MTSEVPPPIDPTNVIELNSPRDSKILGVSLYTGRAEVTRLYKLEVKTGLNTVKIVGLPTVLHQESLRVEGRGAATIHDVTVSYTPSEPAINTSSTLSTLTLKKDRTQKALDRCGSALSALQKYIDSLTVDKIAVDQIEDVIKKFETEAEKLDEKHLELEAQLGGLDAQIRAARQPPQPSKPTKLGLQASVAVFANSPGPIEVVLIYAVNLARWNAAYDIRVNMNTKEKPVVLIYKASINQSTGEDWADVPLTLETATHTFGVAAPVLTPWNISLAKYQSAAKKSAFFLSSRSAAVAEEESSDNDMGFGLFDDGPEEPMVIRTAQVSSNGNISATFRVPGVISIPSDGESHSVTVAQLELDALMSWISVPKRDPRTHLKAKIKNASEYTLLSGLASVYIDGSFISKSNVPPVSPQESFECPLGLDPSIKVTYHPQTKNASQSGLYQKTRTLVVSQRITIHNTKTMPINNLKIMDQFPVSQDTSLTVKRVNPPLALSTPQGTLDKNVKQVSSVSISRGVTASWDGADDPEVDVTALGKNGKFNWVCAMSAQEKVNLVLSWEISSPVSEKVIGL